MKKLIGFAFALLTVCASVSAAQYSLITSSGYDTIFTEAGQAVEETYVLAGSDSARYVDSCEVTFSTGCFVNVLNNDSIVLPSGNFPNTGSYELVGDKLYCSFDNPWLSRRLFTLKGVMQNPSDNPYVVGAGQLSFVMRVKIIFHNGDTDYVQKTFTITRVGKRTVEQIMGNGANQVEYNGMKGYLINFSAYPYGYFVPISGAHRYVVPWTGSSSQSSNTYTDAVTNSWGWDMSKSKLVPTSEIEKLPLKENILVKPGYCAFYSKSSSKYYESVAFGIVKGISKDEALLKYGANKIVEVFEGFLINYSLETSIKVSPKVKQSTHFSPGLGGTAVRYGIDGRKVSSCFTAGLNIIQQQNGSVIKNMNINRFTR